MTRRLVRNLLALVTTTAVLAIAATGALYVSKAGEARRCDNLTPHGSAWNAYECGPKTTTGVARAGEEAARSAPVVAPSPAGTAPRRVRKAASRSRQAGPTATPLNTSHGLRLDVTAYCWTGNRTASGVYPEIGMAAGNSWPFGTRLYVEGVGVVTVTDRYGHDTSLDIYLGRDGCEQRAREFGRRHLLVSVVR